MQPLLQKVPTAKPCWLSQGSPAITALSDEEADGTVKEVEDGEHSMEQESSQSQKMESSPASPTRLCSTSPARLSSSSPARVSLADISNVSNRRPEPEESDLRKQIDALQQRLAEYERGGNSVACMVPHHQPFPAQGLSYPMSWAMSPPPYGHFFPSPFGFYPHFMPAPSPFETQEQ